MPNRTALILELVAVTALAVLLTAGWAVFAGQDINWDQRNYHVYAAHAWLTGTWAWHLAPAQVQSWLNPLASLPFHWAQAKLSPAAAGMVIGGMAGFAPALVYAIARAGLSGLTGAASRWVAGLSAVMALSGPMFVSEIGTSFTDILSSIPILAALWVILGGQGRLPLRAGVAGVLVGAVCGLKLANGVFAIGLLAAVAVHPLSWRPRVLSLAALVLGGLAGYLLTGGAWAWGLWREFGSPVFPFYNALFASPDFPPLNVADERFIPANVAVALSYPFQWLAGLYPSCEMPFRDPRFAVLAVLLVVAAVAGLVARGRSSVSQWPPLPHRSHTRFLLVFALVSYVAWIAQFGIQRYLVPLELLAGVLIFLCLDAVSAKQTPKLAALAAIALFTVVWSRPADWGRQPYGPDWFGFSGQVPRQADMLYVMADGAEPYAYVVPYLAPSRVIRLSGTMTGKPGRYFGIRLAEAIAEHRGPIRSLSVHPLAEAERVALRGFGLVPVEEDCLTFASRLDTFRSCALQRQP